MNEMYTYDMACRVLQDWKDFEPDVPPGLVEFASCLVDTIGQWTANDEIVSKWKDDLVADNTKLRVEIGELQRERDELIDQLAVLTKHTSKTDMMIDFIRRGLEVMDARDFT